MAKRSTQIETTKILNDGEVITTLDKNKMNILMCEEIVKRLNKDLEGNTADTSIKEIIFKCVG